MADKTAEQLSALIDGECEVSEIELAIRRLTRDEQLKARWQRYHLISDAIKNNLPEAIDIDFADRVSKAIDTHIIDTEPSPQRIAIPAVSSWYKPITGFALAASVATVALLGLNMTQPENTVDTASLVAVSSPSEQEANIQTATADSVPDSQSRLNSYLVNHSEYASMNSVHGVLPYVRMVGYETDH